MCWVNFSIAKLDLKWRKLNFLGKAGKGHNKLFSMNIDYFKHEGTINVRYSWMVYAQKWDDNWAIKKNLNKNQIF